MVGPITYLFDDCPVDVGGCIQRRAKPTVIDTEPQRWKWGLSISLLCQHRAQESATTRGDSVYVAKPSICRHSNFQDQQNTGSGSGRRMKRNEVSCGYGGARANCGGAFRSLTALWAYHAVDRVCHLNWGF